MSGPERRQRGHATGDSRRRWEQANRDESEPESEAYTSHRSLPGREFPPKPGAAPAGSPQFAATGVAACPEMSSEPRAAVAEPIGRRAPTHPVILTKVASLRPGAAPSAAAPGAGHATPDALPRHEARAWRASVLVRTVPRIGESLRSSGWRSNRRARAYWRSLSIRGAGQTDNGLDDPPSATAAPVTP